ncbi:DUF5680 domain-containing protein [Paenibacillus ehimensis]|uniref:DUF5680 domain-containing protein n=1 Tax=Paenibacillus ehimensis TaxID=79264 RepID=UPI003D2BCEAA
MTYPNEELVRFLLEAKKNTYASGSGSSSLPSRPGVKELSYQDGEYAYLDSYFGEVHFAGQEIVWHQGKAVWGMNYFGFTADPVEGFPDFLLEALKRVPAEAPYRGPETFLQGEFAYDCRWSGRSSSIYRPRDDPVQRERNVQPGIPWRHPSVRLS